MGLKKSPVISDGISDLCSSKAMSIKLMIKIFWVLWSIEKLKVAYFAKSCWENPATIRFGVSWVLIDPFGELEQGRYEYSILKNRLLFRLKILLWIGTDTCLREETEL